MNGKQRKCKYRSAMEIYSYGTNGIGRPDVDTKGGKGTWSASNGDISAVVSASGSGYSCAP